MARAARAARRLMIIGAKMTQQRRRRAITVAGTGGMGRPQRRRAQQRLNATGDLDDREEVSWLERRV